MTAFTVAGVSLEVEPASRITELEIEAMADLPVFLGDGAETAADSFKLRLEDRIPNARGTDATDVGPARVSTRNGLVRLNHPAFEALLDPSGRSGVLKRDPRTEYPLQVTLRVALCCCLPFASKLPLHAAGVVVGDSGAAFFGPSGAGKTTLSRLSPHPVLSDELVVVGSSPPTMTDAGFFALPSTLPGRHPLTALVALDKGDELTIERLDPLDGFRRLLSAVMVPVSGPLWRAAMAVVNDLANAVPVFRMAWSPSAPPWDRLAETIDAASSGFRVLAPIGAGEGHRQ